jgi:hypothetical protein
MKYPFISKSNDGIFDDKETVKTLRFTTLWYKNTPPQNIVPTNIFQNSSLP